MYISLGLAAIKSHPTYSPRMGSSDKKEKKSKHKKEKKSKKSKRSHTPERQEKKRKPNRDDERSESEDKEDRRKGSEEPRKGGEEEEVVAKTNNDISLSVEETNKLREKLGLKPLDAKKTSTNEVHTPPKNLGKFFHN